MPDTAAPPHEDGPAAVADRRTAVPADVPRRRHAGADRLRGVVGVRTVRRLAVPRQAGTGLTPRWPRRRFSGSRPLGRTDETSGVTASAPVRSERVGSGRAAARTPQAAWPTGDTIERRVFEERDQPTMPAAASASISPASKPISARISSVSPPTLRRRPAGRMSAPEIRIGAATVRKSPLGVLDRREQPDRLGLRIGGQLVDRSTPARRSARRRRRSRPTRPASAWRSPRRGCRSAPACCRSGP